MKIFENVLAKKPKRNRFDLSHERTITCQMGELVPILLHEVMPGDSFTINSEIMVKFQAMIAPIMHKVNVFTHYFFVPMRIIWDEWEEFITGGEDGLSEVAIPKLTISNSSKARYEKCALSDYFGIEPTDVDVGVTWYQDVEISELPFRAYTKIYNDYYRDQNFISEIDIEDPSSIVTLRSRMWERDYFTSCLPFAQRGDAVNVPLGDDAPVELDTEAEGEAVQKWYPWDDYSSAPSAGGPVVTSRGSGTYGTMDDYGLNEMNMDPNGTLYADLSQATGTTVNEIRRVMRLQEWLERNARGGSRYIEQMFMHFGVKSADARLQRPEYLGGGRQPVIVSEVLSTAETTSNPQANMAGHAVSMSANRPSKKYFEEHGYIVGIMSIMPKPRYTTGIPKMFLHTDKFDFPWPEFAQLGEQEVSNWEIKADYYRENLPSSMVFGYQSRYAEYKYHPSMVAGDMRDNMDHWHMGRRFSSTPGLNQTFVTCEPTHRIFAVEDEEIDKMIVYVQNNVFADRPLPYFNVPTI